MNEIQEDLITVGTTRVIDAEKLHHFRHLALPGDVGEAAQTLPDGEMGKWSARNVMGWEDKRTDLPKIRKARTVESPNFGDAATYGTHTHTIEQDVYQREHYEPRNFKLVVELLNAGQGEGSKLYRFAVDHPLDKTSPSFEFDLLLSLNLLQENCGACDVFPSTATRQDYLRTVQLDWDVFPPGARDELIERLTGGRNGEGDVDRTVTARVDLFQRLDPQEYLCGTGGMNSYIGAKFSDNLVVFENVKYGNALYVLYDDWREVSRRSRIDLLRGTDDRFDRFAHTEGWEDRFLDHLRKKKAELGIN